MKAKEFEQICDLAKKGREEIVNHPQTHEDGIVQGCSNGNLVVETEEGLQKEWNFNECYEIQRHRDDFRWN